MTKSGDIIFLWVCQGRGGGGGDRILLYIPILLLKIQKKNFPESGVWIPPCGRAL